jgi:hypothetical protein
MLHLYSNKIASLSANNLFNNDFERLEATMKGRLLNALKIVF